MNKATSLYLDDGIYIPSLEESSRVFHYTTSSGLQGIMEKEFWLTESAFLNDETEFHVALSTIKTVLEGALSGWPELHDFYQMIVEKYYQMNSNGLESEKEVFNGFYVLSLSLDQDNLALWSQCSDGNGYCLGMNFGLLIEELQIRKTTFWHGKVIYNEIEQSAILKKSLDVDFGNRSVFNFYEGLDCIPKLNKKQKDELADFFAVLCTIYGMFFKHQSFHAESEYRIVISAMHEAKTKYIKEPEPVYFRIRDNTFIPFIKIRLNSLNCLETITVGPKNSSQLAISGLDAFLRSLEVHAEIRQSCIPLRY